MATKEQRIPCSGASLRYEWSPGWGREKQVNKEQRSAYLSGFLRSDIWRWTRLHPGLEFMRTMPPYVEKGVQLFAEKDRQKNKVSKKGSRRFSVPNLCFQAICSRYPWDMLTDRFFMTFDRKAAHLIAFEVMMHEHLARLFTMMPPPELISQWMF